MTPPTAGGRLVWLEGPAGDFAFYNGAPADLSGRQWALVLAAAALGFAVLMAPIPWPGGVLGALIPALLFPLIPLMALAGLAPGHWKALFGKVGVRELRLMIGFALLNVVVSMGVGVSVRTFTDVTPNAAAALLSGMDTAGRIAFFAKTLPQLLGEELITVLPFLAMMSVLTRRLGVGRRGAIISAWLLSSLVFGLLHLPTYSWNLIQCVVVIGSARMVLTLAWIRTKNIWVSTGAHIINDWVLFGTVLAGAGLASR